MFQRTTNQGEELFLLAEEFNDTTNFLERHSEPSDAVLHLLRTVAKHAKTDRELVIHILPEHVGVAKAAEVLQTSVLLAHAFAKAGALYTTTLNGQVRFLSEDLLNTLNKVEQLKTAKTTLNPSNG